jgi:lipopolysaccharide/colanic/teichoic acid biosynthesis glycosyltransferase
VALISTDLARQLIYVGCNLGSSSLGFSKLHKGKLRMSGADFSRPSSIQDFIPPSGEYVSAQNGTHASRTVELPPPSTVKGVKGAILSEATSTLSLHGASTDQLPTPCTDDQSRKNVKDSGWWLILDMFVRQKRWTQLAKLNASSIVVNVQESQRRGEVLLTRSIDVMFAFIVLIVLMPVLMIVTILIRLESRGPALFRHSRVGSRGEEFELWKFRSMRIDSLKYERSPTNSTDSRLTRVGRIMRRLSFDEIPQLVNVLKGEMSLVGPRPEMAFIVNQYTTMERKRLLVKPGITGLWQISSGRAAPIHHNLQYDLYYIQNKSVRLDIAILLRTISAVIRGIGAI